MAKAPDASSRSNMKRKIAEALTVPQALGLPRGQINERSALTLLSLLDLKPLTPWAEAGSPLLGITPMMEYFSTHYRKKYAPNSRETVRRFTIHQFEQAGIVAKNPDKPRAINSPDNVYQIESGTRELLQTFGSAQWDPNLAAYFLTRQTLKSKYAAETIMHNIPLTLNSGQKIDLSPGGHNLLIKEIVDKFCTYFTPGADVLYLGDAGAKFSVWENRELAKLGVSVDEHGKMPDVVVFHKNQGWLVLIEAVTSHGPVNPKRHQELKNLFGKATVGLVFVTAFLDRKTLMRYLGDIAWETEVRVAESPTHLIHFNGVRFLGPYQADGNISTPKV